jgi:hypothetical protein
MNFLKSFLKKYSALLLPAAMVIVAFLLLIPTMLVGRGLARNMNDSIQKSSELSRLSSSAPSQATVDDADRYMQQFKKEVQSIRDMAVRSTQRELIQYGLFPEPDDKSTQVYSDFGTHFRKGIEDLIVRLNARDAPSQAEINSHLGSAVAQPAAGGYNEGLFGGGIAGMNVNVNSAQETVIDEVCRERADQISVYADPGVFPNYAFWENYRFPGGDQAIKDCWYSQVAYWIYEDVAAAIKSINGGSQKVDESPVKRLLGVRFQGPVLTRGGSTQGVVFGGINPGMGGQRIAMDKPIYVTSVQRSPFMGQPWTSRIGNETLDVIHFAVSVIADSQAVLPFYKELCSSKPHTFREQYKADGKTVEAIHNQITILESTVSAVNMKSPEHTYYRYGSAGVMRVDLVCEYLLYREGYDSLKPTPVKNEIGQGEGGMAPGTGMGTMSPMDIPFL